LNTTKTPKSICPGCDRNLDAATWVESGPVVPVRGDISVCFYCGEVSVFNEDLRLRPITELEIEMIPLDILSRIQRIRAEAISQ